MMMKDQTMYSNKRPLLDHDDMASSAKRPRSSSVQESQLSQKFDLSLTMYINGYYLQGLLRQFANRLLPLLRAQGPCVRLDFTVNAVNTFLKLEWHKGKVPLLSANAIPFQTDSKPTRQDQAEGSLANVQVSDKTDPGDTLQPDSPGLPPFMPTPTYTQSSAGSVDDKQMSEEVNCVHSTDLFHETGVDRTTQTCRQVDYETQCSDQSTQTDTGIVDTLHQQDARPSTELKEVSAGKEIQQLCSAFVPEETRSKAVAEEAKAAPTVGGLDGDAILKDRSVKKEDRRANTGQHCGNLIQLTGPQVDSPLKQSGNHQTAGEHFAQHSCLPTKSSVQHLTGQVLDDGCFSDKMTSCVDNISPGDLVQSVNTFPPRNMAQFNGYPDSGRNVAHTIHSQSSKDQAVFPKDCPQQVAQDPEFCVKPVRSGVSQGQMMYMHPGRNPPGPGNGICVGTVRTTAPFNGPVLQTAGNMMPQNNVHQTVNSRMPFRNGPAPANVSQAVNSGISGNVMPPTNLSQAVNSGKPCRNGPVPLNVLRQPMNAPLRMWLALGNIPTRMRAQINPGSGRPQLWNGPQCLRNAVTALKASGSQFQRNPIRCPPSFPDLVNRNVRQLVGNLIQLTGGTQSRIPVDTQSHTLAAQLNAGPNPIQCATSSGPFTADNAQARGPTPLNPFLDPTGRPVSQPVLSGDHHVQTGSQVPTGPSHAYNNEAGKPIVSPSMSISVDVKERGMVTPLYREGLQPGGGEKGHVQSSGGLIGQGVQNADSCVGINSVLPPASVSQTEGSCTAADVDITTMTCVQSGSTQEGVKENGSISVSAMGHQMHTVASSRPSGDRCVGQTNDTDIRQTGHEPVGNDEKSVFSEQRTFSVNSYDGRIPSLEDIPLPDDNGHISSLQSIPLPENNGRIPSLQSIPLPDDNGRTTSLQSIPLPDDNGRTTSLQSIPLTDNNGRIPSLQSIPLPDNNGRIPSLQSIPLPDNNGRIPSPEAIMPLPDNKRRLPSLQSIPLPDECVLTTAVEQMESTEPAEACGDQTESEAQTSTTRSRSDEAMNTESTHTPNSNGSTPKACGDQTENEAQTSTIRSRSVEAMNTESTHTPNSNGSTPKAREETPTSEEDEQTNSEKQTSQEQIEIKTLVNQIQMIVGQLSEGRAPTHVDTSTSRSLEDVNSVKSRSQENRSSFVGNVGSMQDENSSSSWSSEKGERRHQGSETDQLSTKNRGTMTYKPLRLNRRVMTDGFCTRESGTLTDMVTWREMSTLTDKNCKKDASTLTRAPKPIISRSSQTVSPVADMATETETAPPCIKADNTDLDKPTKNTMATIPCSQLMRCDQEAIMDVDHTDLKTELVEERCVLAHHKSQCVARKKDCEKVEALRDIPTVAEEGAVRITIKVKIGKSSNIRLAS